MKRELKVKIVAGHVPRDLIGFKTDPDEKGTESP